MVSHFNNFHTLLACYCMSADGVKGYENAIRETKNGNSILGAFSETVSTAALPRQGRSDMLA